jgi:serine/threonine protein kinase
MTGQCYLDIDAEIARGASGVVFKVQDPTLGADIPAVLKKIDGAVSLDDIEIDILFRLRHINLLPGLRLYVPPTGDACFAQDEVGMILPLMDRTGWEFILSKQTTWIERVDVFMQICEGVRFLHTNGIAHFDLKLQNILLRGVENVDPETLVVSTDNQAVVADFGLSRIVNGGNISSDNLLITVTHRPPENLMGSKVFGLESDIWSLGVIGLELLSRKAATATPDFYMGIISGFAKENQQKIDIQPGYWSKDLIQMMSRDPNYKDLIERYSASELIMIRGPQTPYSDRDKRREFIIRLVESEPIGNLIFEMMNMRPNARPNIHMVCDALGVIPRPGSVVVSLQPEFDPTDRLALLATSTLQKVNQQVLTSRGFPLSVQAVAQAERLCQRSLDLIRNTRRDIRTLVTLLAFTCLWIIAKMYGHRIDIEVAVFMLRGLVGFDSSLNRVPGWYTLPWSVGKPIIPSSLIVMERMVVERNDGILL